MEWYKRVERQRAASPIYRKQVEAIKEQYISVDKVSGASKKITKPAKEKKQPPASKKKQTQ